MNKLFRPFLSLILLGSMLATTACKDSGNPEPDDAQELITTVILRLDPEDTEKGQSVTATWRDLDGPGGQAPAVESLTLEPNTAYNGTLTFVDESQAGTQHDITAEIREEGHEHEVFYVVTPTDLVTILKTDRDIRNRPIGLETSITTGEITGAGTIQIVLKHQPKLKGASSTITTGETDADITFETFVQE